MTFGALSACRLNLDGAWPARLARPVHGRLDVVDRLASDLERWRRGKLRIARPDPENLLRLRALGYVE